MTAKDLRDLLDSLAREAPDPSALHPDRLSNRIRRKRRMHRVSIAALGTALAAVSVGGVVLVLQLGWPFNQGVNNAEPDPSSRQSLSIGGCGSKISGKINNHLPLEMAADLPRVAEPDERGLLHGTVTITNQGQETIQGITAVQPDITVTKKSIVVGSPVGVRDVGVIIRLSPGESKKFELVANARACSGEYGSDDGLLRPGRYELFASLSVQVKVPGSQDPGDKHYIQGGPWAVTVP
jgi:hypothetical protein